jgi:hypothetical protein
MTPTPAEQIRLQLCGQCAKRAPGTARFCPRCGTRLRPGSPGDNTYLAVHKAIKSRSEHLSEPLVIPRPVLSPATPPTTPVLGYQPAKDRKQQPPPRTPPPKKKSSWPMVLLAILGFRMLVAALTTNRSRSPATYPPAPLPSPPPPVMSSPQLNDAWDPGRVRAVRPSAPPQPSRPQPIPGPYFTVDDKGQVIVNTPTPPGLPNRPAAPSPPAVPAAPSPYQPPSARPTQSPHR